MNPDTIFGLEIGLLVLFTCLVGILTWKVAPLLVEDHDKNIGQPVYTLYPLENITPLAVNRLGDLPGTRFETDICAPPNFLDPFTLLERQLATAVRPAPTVLGQMERLARTQQDRLVVMSEGGYHNVFDLESNGDDCKNATAYNLNTQATMVQRQDDGKNKTITAGTQELEPKWKKGKKKENDDTVSIKAG